MAPAVVPATAMALDALPGVAATPTMGCPGASKLAAEAPGLMAKATMASGTMRHLKAVGHFSRKAIALGAEHATRPAIVLFMARKGMKALMGRPSRWDPHGPRWGWWCLHGFTGTPFEVRLLAEDLAARGHAVEGPRLAGHGGSTSELAATRWPDWLASANQALDRLLTRCERPVVCGLSMGALLALELGRRTSEVAAICALAPALFLTPSALRFVDFTRRLPILQRAALPKLAGSDLLDPEMRRLNGIAQGRSWMPISALSSLVDLGQQVRSHLQRSGFPFCWHTLATTTPCRLRAWRPWRRE